MTPDRLDELLERALATGQLPADATPEERAEIEPLLGPAGTLLRNASRIRAEASAAMPTARARFQRHLAEQQTSARPPVAPVAGPKKGFLGRFFGGGAMALASSAAAIGVIAVLALVVLQPFSSPESAAALTVDDYVQVQGVVADSGEGSVTIQSPNLGRLEVALSELTAVTDNSGVRDAASLKPGDPVLISGVVTARRAIAASNVAVAENQGVPTPEADRTKVPVLKEFREGLEGKLSLITLSPDGKRARVLLVTGNKRLLVDIEPRAMDQFLAEHPGALGSVVRVVQAAGLPKGLFHLELANGAQATATAQGGAPAPQFQNIRGVVVSRNANVLMVRTDRGIIPVVVRPLTSIRFGNTELTPEEIRAAETVIGYEVSITGNPDATEGRRLVASIVVVLGKEPVRPSGQ